MGNIHIAELMDEITALPESGLSVLKDMQNDDLMPAKVKMLHGSHLYRNPLEPGNSKPPNLPSLLCRAVGSAEELLPSGGISLACSRSASFTQVPDIPSSKSTLTG